MQSWRWHVILLQIMLLLVLLALLAVADCSWDDLTEDTLHYEGNYTTRAFKNTFKDGEIAPYKCQNGYTVSGLYSGPHVPNATCRGDKWEYDSRNLVCKAVSCGHPCPGGSCRNGAVNPPVFNFPNFVNFTCNPGYHLVTHDDQKWDPSYQVYCTSSGRWSRQAPKCVEVVCPQPTPIANGQVSPSMPIFRENDVIQYTCDQPYTLRGDATRRCQNDATWSGNEPVCESRRKHVDYWTPNVIDERCPAPKLPFGEIKTNGDYGVGAHVIYVCDDGKRGAARCGEDLKWSPDPPGCTDTKQKPTPAPPAPSPPPRPPPTTTASTPLPATPPGATTCPRPGSIVNGAVDVPPGTLGVNAKIRYRCDAGYTLVGVAERVCQGDGSWSNSEPVCQAAPPSTTCSAPPPIANGAVDVPQGTLGVNSRVQYRCDAGYTLVGTSERVCLSDGSWSGAEPVCQAIVATTCPTPASITNGAVDVPPGTLGVNTKVRYQCNAGYMLVGVTERVCQMDGSWSGVEPYCQATGQPPQPPQPPAAPTTSQSPMPDAHPPGGDEKPSDSSSGEAQTTSWVLLSLVGVLVLAGAVVLYMFYRKHRRARDASGSSNTRTQ
ncbi:P-selectin-like isoform X2 [Dermacentor andersoni]|uniref:P-selectin-like isoform X2 n=1 Tax=Dermacentor andersoni TaxID=34620 RepID=UPI00241680E7|nr:CUB and sushi domain-containing protein 3-like isoform X2 [Dermacentor andersoni]